MISISDRVGNPSAGMSSSMVPAAVCTNNVIRSPPTVWRPTSFEWFRSICLQISMRTVNTHERFCSRIVHRMRLPLITGNSSLFASCSATRRMWCVCRKSMAKCLTMISGRFSDSDNSTERFSGKARRPKVLQRFSTRIASSKVSAKCLILILNNIYFCVFRLIEAFGINIGESLPVLPIFADLWLAISKNKALADRITVRSTAVQVTVLQSNDTDNILCVANTHLYFHPDADHIRLLQFYLGFLYVQHIRDTIAVRLSRPPKDISIVFCGDFNSTPDCGIYRLMTQKHVPAGFVDFGSSKL